MTLERLSQNEAFLKTPGETSHSHETFINSSISKILESRQEADWKVTLERLSQNEAFLKTPDQTSHSPDTFINSSIS